MPVSQSVSQSEQKSEAGGIVMSCVVRAAPPSAPTRKLKARPLPYRSGGETDDVISEAIT